MYPQTSVTHLESNPIVPSGSGERFGGGYGIMGLPFTSGHLLAFRRIPASSIGPGYTSVWHRGPSGVWTFYTDIDPELACVRFYGNAIQHSIRTPIDVRWESPEHLRIAVQQAGLVLAVQLKTSPATRALNWISPLLPAWAWKNLFSLRLMANTVRFMLGLGKVNLSGFVPNGHFFRANPQQL